MVGSSIECSSRLSTKGDGIGADQLQRLDHSFGRRFVSLEMLGFEAADRRRCRDRFRKLSPARIILVGHGV